GTADRNRSHWSTSKTPSYTKSVSWQHHRRVRLMDLHQMLLIHDILHCKEMSKMKDVDQIFDALDCHILREYLILLFYD
ncbi:hypothetical protein BK406_02225, partial [Escherichia coli]